MQVVGRIILVVIFGIALHFRIRALILGSRESSSTYTSQITIKSAHRLVHLSTIGCPSCTPAHQERLHRKLILMKHLADSGLVASAMPLKKLSSRMCAILWNVQCMKKSQGARHLLWDNKGDCTFLSQNKNVASVEFNHNSFINVLVEII